MYSSWMCNIRSYLYCPLIFIEAKGEPLQVNRFLCSINILILRKYTSERDKIKFDDTQVLFDLKY